MATKKKTPAQKASAPKKANSAQTTAVKNAAKALVDQVETATEPEVTLATRDQEKAMRKAATSPAARKAALAAGKKDPLEKWGDPDADPAEQSIRGAALGR